MNVFTSLGSFVSGALDFNKATLSGALDIIALKHDGADGDLVSTPWQVRFGKLKLFRSRDKLVRIYCNGQKTDLVMRLGDAGEAYFIHLKHEEGVAGEAETGGQSRQRRPDRSTHERLSGATSHQRGVVSEGVKSLASPSSYVANATIDRHGAEDGRAGDVASSVDDKKRRVSDAAGEKRAKNLATAAAGRVADGHLQDLPQLEADGTVTLRGKRVGRVEEWDAIVERAKHPHQQQIQQQDGSQPGHRRRDAPAPLAVPSVDQQRHAQLVESDALMAAEQLLAAAAKLEMSDDGLPTTPLEQVAQAIAKAAVDAAKHHGGQEVSHIAVDHELVPDAAAATTLSLLSLRRPTMLRPLSDSFSDTEIAVLSSPRMMRKIRKANKLRYLRDADVQRAAAGGGRVQPAASAAFATGDQPPPDGGGGAAPIVPAAGGRSTDAIGGRSSWDFPRRHSKRKTGRAAAPPLLGGAAPSSAASSAQVSLNGAQVPSIPKSASATSLHRTNNGVGVGFGGSMVRPVSGSGASGGELDIKDVSVAGLAKRRLGHKLLDEHDSSGPESTISDGYAHRLQGSAGRANVGPSIAGGVPAVAPARGRQPAAAASAKHRKHLHLGHASQPHPAASAASSAVEHKFNARMINELDSHAGLPGMRPGEVAELVAAPPTVPGLPPVSPTAAVSATLNVEREVSPAEALAFSAAVQLENERSAAADAASAAAAHSSGAAAVTPGGQAHVGVPTSASPSASLDSGVKQKLSRKSARGASLEAPQHHITRSTSNIPQVGADVGTSGGHGLHHADDDAKSRAEAAAELALATISGATLKAVEELAVMATDAKVRMEHIKEHLHHRQPQHQHAVDSHPSVASAPTEAAATNTPSMESLVASVVPSSSSSAGPRALSAEAVSRRPGSASASGGAGGDSASVGRGSVDRTRASSRLRGRPGGRSGMLSSMISYLTGENRYVPDLSDTSDDENIRADEDAYGGYSYDERNKTDEGPQRPTGNSAGTGAGTAAIPSATMAAAGAPASSAAPPAHAREATNPNYRDRSAEIEALKSGSRLLQVRQTARRKPRRRLSTGQSSSQAASQPGGSGTVPGTTVKGSPSATNTPQQAPLSPGLIPSPTSPLALAASASAGASQPLPGLSLPPHARKAGGSTGVVVPPWHASKKYGVGTAGMAAVNGSSTSSTAPDAASSSSSSLMAGLHPISTTAAASAHAAETSMTLARASPLASAEASLSPSRRWTKQDGIPDAVLAERSSTSKDSAPQLHARLMPYAEGMNQKLVDASSAGTVPHRASPETVTASTPSASASGPGSLRGSPLSPHHAALARPSPSAGTPSLPTAAPGSPMVAGTDPHTVIAVAPSVALVDSKLPPPAPASPAVERASRIHMRWLSGLFTRGGTPAAIDAAVPSPQSAAAAAAGAGSATGQGALAVVAASAGTPVSSTFRAPLTTAKQPSRPPSPVTGLPPIFPSNSMDERGATVDGTDAALLSGRPRQALLKGAMPLHNWFSPAPSPASSPVSDVTPVPLQVPMDSRGRNSAFQPSPLSSAGDDETVLTPDGDVARRKLRRSTSVPALRRGTLNDDVVPGHAPPWHAHSATNRPAGDAVLRPEQVQKQSAKSRLSRRHSVPSQLSLAVGSAVVDQSQLSQHSAEHSGTNRRQSGAMTSTTGKADGTRLDTASGRKSSVHSAPGPVHQLLSSPAASPASDAGSGAGMQDSIVPSGVSVAAQPLPSPVARMETAVVRAANTRHRLFIDVLEAVLIPHLNAAALSDVYIPPRASKAGFLTVTQQHGPEYCALLPRTLVRAVHKQNSLVGAGDRGAPPASTTTNARSPRSSKLQRSTSFDMSALSSEQRETCYDAFGLWAIEMTTMADGAASGRSRASSAAAAAIAAGARRLQSHESMESTTSAATSLPAPAVAAAARRISKRERFLGWIPVIGNYVIPADAKKQQPKQLETAAVAPGNHAATASHGSQGTVASDADPMAVLRQPSPTLTGIAHDHHGSGRSGGQVQSGPPSAPSSPPFPGSPHWPPAHHKVSKSGGAGRGSEAGPNTGSQHHHDTASVTRETDSMADSEDLALERQASSSSAGQLHDDADEQGSVVYDTDASVESVLAGRKPHKLATDTGGSHHRHAMRFTRSLQPTSEQLKSLPLVDGANTITFEVAEDNVSVTSNLYLWSPHSKIIISDVDGTITKSDVLGHIFFYVGRDWTHAGVAQLYSNVKANGYNIVYLTSRAIGQTDATKVYLQNIKQFAYSEADAKAAAPRAPAGAVALAAQASSAAAAATSSALAPSAATAPGLGTPSAASTSATTRAYPVAGASPASAPILAAGSSSSTSSSASSTASAPSAIIVDGSSGSIGSFGVPNTAATTVAASAGASAASLVGVASAFDDPAAAASKRTGPITSAGGVPATAALSAASLATGSAAAVAGGGVTGAVASAATGGPQAPVYQLPPGPVITSPDRLFTAFTREVILRRPQEFKIAALRDIQRLFPPGYNPFYAGFGNRDTDVLAYRTVGVPEGKIFIINSAGEIRQANKTYNKTYHGINGMVHEMFPLMRHLGIDAPGVGERNGNPVPVDDTYSDVNYWRKPLPKITESDEEAAAPVKPVVTKKAAPAAAPALPPQVVVIGSSTAVGKSAIAASASAESASTVIVIGSAGTK